jgi:hypothetical protein
MITDASVTRIIAMYGAVLATITASWSVYLGARDRGRLRVRAKVPTDNSLGQEIIGDEIVFELVNSGRRTIYVRDVGLYGRKARPSGLPIKVGDGGPLPLPMKLEPGERKLLRTALPRMEAVDIRRLCVWSGTGKAYCSCPGDLHDLQRLMLRRGKRPERLPALTRLRARLPLWVRL